MMTEILTYTPTASPVCVQEVLRYAGARAADDTLLSLLDSCMKEAEGVLSYRVAYTVLPLCFEEETLCIGSIRTTSAALARHLAGCDRVILFGATVGLALDRLIAKYSTPSSARALLLDALGTERIEALADAFCSEMAEMCAKEGRSLCPRFSPGYGDLPLSVQSALFCMLDLPRRIGLSLTDTLMMTPQKSVTAFVGIKSEKN